MPLVLGVDSSTQSTKVEVRDADDGRLIASGRAPHPSTTPPRSEQDPEAWWQALAAAVHQTGVRDVAAISVAAQQHGMVVLDAGGSVVRRAKLWNDTESAEDAAALVEVLKPHAWARYCGSVPVPAFTITKLAWLRRSEPDAFEQLSHVLLPHDWLTARLCGRLVTDCGDASGTGYWSPADGRWRPDLLALVDDQRVWEQALPEVLGPGEAAGRLTPAAAADLGLPEATLVASGTGDNMGAALGLGLEAGDVVVSLGTSGTIYTVADEPSADETGAVAGFADATGRFLPLVCTMNGTKVLDAVAGLLGVGHDDFDELALAAPAGAGGLVLLPYFDGERTPNRPAARGILAGISSEVSRELLARSTVEGVVCGLLDGLDALVAAGIPIQSDGLVLIGGGAASSAVRRVIADLSGRRIAIPPGTEHVARGACVQAAAVLRNIHPREVAESWRPQPSICVEPDPKIDATVIRRTYASLRVLAGEAPSLC